MAAFEKGTISYLMIPFVAGQQCFECNEVYLDQMRHGMLKWQRMNESPRYTTGWVL
jgi:hypothetical protein